LQLPKDSCLDIGSTTEQTDLILRECECSQTQVSVTAQERYVWY